MDSLRPGQDGEPLPAGEWVLRLAPISKDFLETGRPSPKAFELSTEDRKGTPPRLSVWAERLTTPRQAWVLSGGRPEYQLALRLNVDVIRALRPEPDSPEVPSLDVQWERLMVTNENGRWVPDTRPGASGHAGIAGLLRGGPVSRLHTQSLRSQLADLAAAILLSLSSTDS
jgi:hypothetical protein